MAGSKKSSRQTTTGYELMFEFLGLSPTYELARKSRNEGLTDEEKLIIPSDFDQVLTTYDRLGNVQETFFRAWLVKVGLDALGGAFNTPVTRVLKVIGKGEKLNSQEPMPELSQFLDHIRVADGLGPTMLLSVPLDQPKTVVLRQLKKLIESNIVPVEEKAPSARFELAGQRLRPDVLFNGLRLLWERARNPKKELWRLGAQVDVSKSYSGVLDPQGSRKTKGEIEQNDREILSKITHRALVKYQRIVENAARGKFPSDDPVELKTFDYEMVYALIQRRKSWQRAARAVNSPAFRENQKAVRGVKSKLHGLE